MKRVSILFAMMILVFLLSAQSYNTERVALTNYLTRMYYNAPFEGVRIIEDYEQTYLLSVVSLDASKYNENVSVMNRIASVKAMSQASRFFNGSKITDELVIHTIESSNDDATMKIIETINENSVGYVKTLEQLTNFRDGGNFIFLFVSPITK